MKNLLRNIWTVLGSAAICWVLLSGFVFSKKESDSSIKELRSRYEMIYGQPRTQAMRAVENYIIIGDQRGTALMVDIVKELEAPHEHMD